MSYCSRCEIDPDELEEERDKYQLALQLIVARRCDCPRFDEMPYECEHDIAKSALRKEWQ